MITITESRMPDVCWLTWCNEMETPLQKEAREILYEDKFLRVEWIPSQAERLVLCFTGIGHSLGGIDVQQSEFTGTGLKIGAPIFIVDKTRSWGNALSLETLSNVVERVAEGRQMVSLGNSMGAFLAIATSKNLGVNDVVAFAPQYSVNPKIVPNETRWQKYRINIESYRISSLEHSFSNSCRYHIFVGDSKPEKMHWELFPRIRNVFMYIIPGQGHEVAQWLKNTNALEAAIADCLGKEISPSKIAGRYELLLRP